MMTPFFDDCGSCRAIKGRPEDSSVDSPKGTPMASSLLDAHQNANTRPVENKNRDHRKKKANYIVDMSGRLIQAG